VIYIIFIFICISKNHSLLFCIFIWRYWVWTQVLIQARKVFCHSWAMPPALFALFIFFFWKESWVFAWAMIHLTVLPTWLGLQICLIMPGPESFVIYIIISYFIHWQVAIFSKVAFINVFYFHKPDPSSFILYHYRVMLKNILIVKLYSHNTQIDSKLAFISVITKFFSIQLSAFMRSTF
jgi:hypothetical protein